MDNSKGREFQAGQILVTTSGEYSSYCIGGVSRVLRNFNAPETRKAYRAAVGRRIKPSFDGWLIIEGYVEPVTYSEWHEGDGDY